MRIGIVLAALGWTILLAACQSGLSEAEVELLVSERIEAANLEMAESMFNQLQSGTDVTLGRDEDSVTTIRGTLIVDGVVGVKDELGRYIATIQGGENGGFVVWNDSGEEIVKLGRHPNKESPYAELKMLGNINFQSHLTGTGLLVNGTGGGYLGFHDVSGELVGVIHTRGIGGKLELVSHR